METVQGIKKEVERMMMSIQKVHIIRQCQRLKAVRRAPPAFTKNYREQGPVLDCAAALAANPLDITRLLHYKYADECASPCYGFGKRRLRKQEFAATPLCQPALPKKTSAGLHSMIAGRPAEASIQ